MHRHISVLAVCCMPLAAQNACEGFGIGSAYLSTTPAIVGQQLTMNVGSPASPGGVGLLAFGNGAGPAFPLCLDISGLFVTFVAPLDANGNCVFVIPVPTGLFGAPPLFAKGLALEGAGTLSFSKSVRVSFENANSSRELPPMAGARSKHTCTAFESGPRDNRTGVLVAGGASGSMIFPVALATTEVFDSLTRTWTLGPVMAVPRAQHRAVRLLDGRILISGGMVNAPPPSVGGPATASCEIYSPATNTLAPTGSMLQARMGHGLTVLPDGRVLASGGLTDWTDPATNFANRCSSGVSSTEIWNPATGTWSAGPAMISVRAGHSQTLLASGAVLLAGGVNGGTFHVISGFGTIEIPTFTGTCEVFDPTANTLAPTAPLTLPRAFHGASLLPNGNVLITGGAASIGGYGEAAATTSCDVYATASGTWAPTATLTNGVAFHTHVVDVATGRAVVAGGFIGNFAALTANSAAALHDGTNLTIMNSLGVNQSLPAQVMDTGLHAAAVLHDGTVLITGGYSGFGAAGTTHARALLLITP